MSKIERALLIGQFFATLWIISYFIHILDIKGDEWWLFPLVMTVIAIGVVSIVKMTDALVTTIEKL